MSGFNTAGSDINLVVSQYLGSFDLARVVIKVLQPDPVVSPTISASLSVPDGSTTFSSTTSANRLQEQSAVNGADTSAYDALFAITGNSNVISDYNVTKNSPSWAGQTLTSGSPINTSLSVAQSPITIFDSANFGQLSSADLNAIFRDISGGITFAGQVEDIFRWNRTEGEPTPITASLSGVNSGQIVIEYYVPEPGTVALIGLGGMMLLIRRRRQA